MEKKLDYSDDIKTIKKIMEESSRFLSLSGLSGIFAGVTAIARSVGATISPSLTGIFLSVPFLLSVPFFLSGGLKIIYDLLLYRSFRQIKPPEEQG